MKILTTHTHEKKNRGNISDELILKIFFAMLKTTIT